MKEISLGQKIKELRQQRKMTQSDLANQLGVSLSCIRNYEQGYRSTDTTNLIVKMAKLFNVSLDYLLGMDNPSPILQYGGHPVSSQKEEIISLIIQKNLSNENLALLKNLIESLK